MKVTSRTNELFEPLLKGVGRIMVAAYAVNTRIGSSTQPPTILAAMLLTREYIGTNKGQEIYTSLLHWVQGFGAPVGRGNG